MSAVRLAKPASLEPRHVRQAVRTCQPCAGFGQIDPDGGHGSGERAYPCPECRGNGCVPQLRQADALIELARWRRMRRAAPRFYAHARRVAFQPVRIPGGAL